MKKILVLSLLVFSVCAFGDGVSMSVTVDGTSSSNSESIDVASEIANKIDVLQKKFHAKLNKLDQKRTDKIVDEIYELLALLPDDLAISNENTNSNLNISFEVNEQQSDSFTEKEETVVEETSSPSAMSDSEFQQLLSNVKAEGFADDKTSVVRIAAKSKYFTISQLIELLKLFSFSEDKINIVQIVYSRVVDKDNAHNLLGAFTYSDDKSKVESIISQ